MVDQYGDHALWQDEKFFHIPLVGHKWLQSRCRAAAHASERRSSIDDQGDLVAFASDWRSIVSAWSLVGTWSSWEPPHRRGIKRKRGGLHIADGAIDGVMHGDALCVSRGLNH